MGPRWDGDPMNAFDPYSWEEGISRTTDKEPDRVNKLKALGNAIVPQVAYVLLAAMCAADQECA